MSQIVTELCALLIEDTYGELFSNIFSTLLLYGRLPLPRLIQRSRLSPRQCKYGLSVMVQQHLVLHYASRDDSLTYYEADWRSAYSLIRSGKIIELVQERFGEYAATITSQLLLLGHARVGHLETLSQLVSGAERKKVKTKTPLENGLHAVGDAGDLSRGDLDQSRHSPANLHSTLRLLANHGLIIRVREAHYRSQADLLYEVQVLVKASGLFEGLKGKNLQSVIDETVQSKLKEWQDGSISQPAMTNGLSQSDKRPAERLKTIASSKRARLENGVGHKSAKPINEESLCTVPYLNENMVIRINHEKFAVLFRNQRLIALAERSISKTASQVYGSLLKCIEDEILRCRENLEFVPGGEEIDVIAPTASTRAVLRDLDPQVPLEGAVAVKPPSEIDWKALRRINNNKRKSSSDSEEATAVGDASSDEDEEEDDDDLNGVDEHGNITGVDHDRTSDGIDNDFAGPPQVEDGTDLPQAPNRTRFHLLEQHLHLLFEEPYHFTARQHTSGLLTWSVPYRRLATTLRHREISSLILSRFGAPALRILHILQAKGKLDEKRLSEIALLSTKDLRQHLARLNSAGFLELQEVPRDTQRQPSRTMYLWFYDPDRIRKLLLEDTYKAMARCLQRIRVEREKVRGLLEKAERSDVRGHEKEYLEEGEREALRVWRGAEGLLLGEVGRLDDLVMVLRDF